MSLLAFFTALAQDAPAGQPGGGSSFFIVIILMFAGMYFLVIAPQRKKQKEHQKKIESLKAGDRIVTNGGLFATVTSVKSDRLIIKLVDGTKAELAKNFVASVVQGDSDAKDLQPAPTEPAK
ncbi:preprotein translocase subunit YajC [Ruficoccus sp. ZRK36]|uniref:preprotein translocase subunit YajC n=1 Tax=Ruficoccus sp. ZRK36 TaxID=2866311 RepID=UPI001C72C99B|nr:preprotein translocase subunit YajC [Ruficoccus sp. ZRK36]QYY36501.1 preprotein translocase subunit YajC [Ruficoccus sp. ZRK36]